MKKGRLIEITGIDGCGKSTQSRLITEYLNTKNIPTLLIESGTSSLVGKVIQKLNARDIKVSSSTRALIYAVDYSCLLPEKIIPNLNNGVNVIMDRYLYSSIAYNSSLGFNIRWTKNLYDFAIWPDLVVWIDTKPEVCYQRILKERKKLSIYEVGIGETIDKKAFVEFQNKVREVFISLAKENKDIIKVVNGNDSLEKVYSAVKEIIVSKIK